MGSACCHDAKSEVWLGATRKSDGIRFEWCPDRPAELKVVFPKVRATRSSSVITVHSPCNSADESVGAGADADADADCMNASTCNTDANTNVRTSVRNTDTDASTPKSTTPPTGGGRLSVSFAENSAEDGGSALSAFERTTPLDVTSLMLAFQNFWRNGKQTRNTGYGKVFVIKQ